MECRVEPTIINSRIVQSRPLRSKVILGTVSPKIRSAPYSILPIGYCPMFEYSRLELRNSMIGRVSSPWQGLSMDGAYYSQYVLYYYIVFSLLFSTTTSPVSSFLRPSDAITHTSQGSRTMGYVNATQPQSTPIMAMSPEISPCGKTGANEF